MRGVAAGGVDSAWGSIHGSQKNNVRKIGGNYRRHH